MSGVATLARCERMQWEFEFLSFLQGLHNPVVDSLMIAFSALGSGGVIWFVMVSFLLFRKEYRRVGVEALVSLAISFVIANLILKLAVNRVRPFVTYDALVPLGLHPIDSSFPSGHTSSSFAVALVIFFHRDMFGERRWMGIVPVVIAALIAFSRLWNVVHYPTDVVAGIAVGVLSAYVAEWISKRYLVKYFPDSPPSAP